MKEFDIGTMAKYTDRPGFIGTFIHSEGTTLAHWQIAGGTELALHSHPHEQISFLLSGRLDLRSGNDTVHLEPGNAVVFAGDEPHSGFAHEDCIVLDVFCPCREDFKLTK